MSSGAARVVLQHEVGMKMAKLVEAHELTLSETLDVLIGYVAWIAHTSDVPIDNVAEYLKERARSVEAQLVAERKKS